PSPIQVPGLSGITAIGAGAQSTIALKNDGTVWRWGNCPWSGSQPTPQQVPGLSGVSIISTAGYYDSVVVKNDGTIWRWWNTDYNTIPVQIADTPLSINFTGNGSGSVSLSTGGSYSSNTNLMVPGN